MSTDAEVKRALKRIAEQATAERFYNGTIASVSGRHATVVLDGEGTGTVSAYRGTFEPIIGARVTVERLAGTNEYRIVGVARDALADRSPAPYDFERLGQLLYYPLAREALNLGSYTLAPTGLEMTVYNTLWLDGDGVMHFIPNQTLNFTPAVPATDSRWVVVLADPTTETLSLYQHGITNTPQGQWVDAVNASTTGGYVPVLAVRLDAGQTGWLPAHKQLVRGYSFQSKYIVSVLWPFDAKRPPPPSSFLDLTDTPSTYTGQDGKIVRVNEVNNKLEFVSPTNVDGAINVDDTVVTVSTASRLELPAGTLENTGGGVARYVSFGLGTAPEAAATTPSGCVAWYRANTGVTIDSLTRVSAWNDQSGNGNHLTQTIATDQPLLIRSTLMNGFPCILFDGVDDVLTAPFTPQTGAGARTIVAVVQWAVSIGGSVQRSLISWGTDSSLQSFALSVRQDAINTYGAFFTGTSFSARTPPAEVQPAIVVLGYDGTTSYLWYNGYAAGSQNNNLNTVAGVTLRVGASIATTFTHAMVAEIIIYNTFLSSSNRNTLVAQLGKKYNIPVGTA